MKAYGRNQKRQPEACRLPFSERVMGLEPTNSSLGSYCLTTWRHPQNNFSDFTLFLGVIYSRTFLSYCLNYTRFFPSLLFVVSSPITRSEYIPEYFSLLKLDLNVELICRVVF